MQATSDHEKRKFDRLVAAAKPLLLTLPTLRASAVPTSVEALRAQLIDLFLRFNIECDQAGIPTENVRFARYALCALLDQTIQRTQWGIAAEFSRDNLSNAVVGENLGGEFFFKMLDKLMLTPAPYLDVLHLYFVCLSLGFTGRYERGDAGDRAELAEKRDRLYNQVIRDRTGDGELSPKWEGLGVGARRLPRFGAAWLVSSAVALAGLLLFMGYALSLAGLRDDIGLGQLAFKPVQILRAAAVPPPAPVAPRLAKLLQEEIDARRVTVDETAAESLVTLTGEQTFDPGKAMPTADAELLIAKIGVALDRVDGRVVVIGHTDSTKPSPSLLYQSNFELSKARARNVAQIVRANLREPTRVSDEGKGESEPVASNDTPAGRARNRRVEIVLRVSSAD